MEDTVQSILQGVREGQELSVADALTLAQAASRAPEAFERVLSAADTLRRGEFGQRVTLCAIAAGKVGACSEDCAWCAQSYARSPNTETQAPTVLAAKRIADLAKQAFTNGASRFSLVDSGRAPNQGDLQRNLDALQDLTSDNPTGRFCASLGLITAEQARALAAAGVSRYHHNLETSRNHFPQVVTSHTFEDKLATLRAARSAGLQLCCGVLLGIGESWHDRIDLAHTLRTEVHPDSVPMNFLHPIAGTRLADRPPMPAREALLAIAIYRLMLPTTDIRIAGGRETVLGDLQSWIFRAGATGLMIGNYLTTAGRSVANDVRMISDLGLEMEISNDTANAPAK